MFTLYSAFKENQHFQINNENESFADAHRWSWFYCKSNLDKYLILEIIDLCIKVTLLFIQIMQSSENSSSLKAGSTKNKNSQKAGINAQIR